ncbi:hypothetical protein [Zhihengliuella sp.]|uniref:hypothetical protein n=1 Tax=Zhihengliuella sp. TaxID=1954483 RepID=UPI0028122991|nr:hypothetical protein [Zhihengliuella sp.]
MNIEFLRSPWFLLAVLLLATGAFLLTATAWNVAGWALVVVGLAAVGFARYRQG